MANIDKLLEVMALLRDPDSGCPWDVAQTFATIAPYTIEEAYEVADAIAREDIGDLRAELGDLLLQVVFHSRMAEEKGHFDFDDVAGTIHAKMLRRHPHVFGSDGEREAGAQAEGWEEIKARERAEAGDGSALAGVATAMPALMRAQKLGIRAGAVGFDWSDRAGVLAKIHEEMDELEEAVGTRDSDEIESEFGDLLFAVVNLARHLDIDPEHALRRANYKFEARFREMERTVGEQGRSLKGMALADLEHEWRQAKKRLAAD